MSSNVSTSSRPLKRKKKHSKAYYVGSAKRQKTVLDINQRGFFITCGNGHSRAKSCINEAYGLLGQFADNLYGAEQRQIEPDNNAKTVTDDVEAEIAAEIESLKSVNNSERRFQAVDCGVKNCIFIKTQVKDPCELAYKILDDIRTKKESRARYMCRLIPVSITCRAFVDDIRKAAEILLPKYFKGTGPDGKTFCIVFKARCNKSVSREAVHEALNPIVQSLDSTNKVELKTPQLVIIVEVMAKICCLSVVAEYFQLKKYNVVEMAAPTITISKTAELDPPKPDADLDSKVQDCPSGEALSETSHETPAVKTDLDGPPDKNAQINKEENNEL